MARTLQEATQHMRGVGREEGIALASYLQRAVLRTEHLLEDIIESGNIDEMKKGSSKEGQEMLDRILELAKEAKGKSAAETTEINGRISAIVKTLEKSGKDGAKLVKGLKDSGLVDAVSKRATIGELFKDEIKGKVEGFKDKMIRKIPMVGGILANVRKAHIAGKQAEAEALSKQGGDGGNLKEDQQQDQQQDQEQDQQQDQQQDQPLKVIQGQEQDQEQDQEQGQEQGVAVRTIQDQPLEVIQQRADVAHNDAQNDSENLRIIAIATSATKEAQDALEDDAKRRAMEDYDAGEEEREKKKKGKDSFLKYKGPSFFGKKGKGGAGGMMGVIGDVLGPVLGGALTAAFPTFIKLLGPVVSGLGTALGAIGSVLTSPLVLAAGTALAGFWAGGKLFEHWLGPEMDKAFQRDMNARAKGREQVEKQVFVKDEEGKKIEVYNLGGKMMTKPQAEAAVKEGGVYSSLEEALAAEGSEVSRATVQVSTATGKTRRGGTEVFESMAEMNQAQENIEDVREVMGAGVGGTDEETKHAQIIKWGIGFRNQEKFYTDIMDTNFKDYDEAANMEKGFQSEQYGTAAFVEQQLEVAKREGLVNEFYKILELFPFVKGSTDRGFGFSLADVEWSDDLGRYEVTGNLDGYDYNIKQYLKEFGEPGSRFDPTEFGMKPGLTIMHEGGIVGGDKDIMARLRPSEAVIPLDDPDVLQMMQMITANAMVKGTHQVDRGEGGSATTIAPITSTVSVSNDNIFATSPITRNPEKTIQRVTYQ